MARGACSRSFQVRLIYSRQKQSKESEFLTYSMWFFVNDTFSLFALWGNNFNYLFQTDHKDLFCIIITLYPLKICPVMHCTDGDYMMQQKLTIFFYLQEKLFKDVICLENKTSIQGSLYWAERSWVSKDCKMNSVGCETKYYLHQKILSLASRMSNGIPKLLFPVCPRFVIPSLKQLLTQAACCFWK